MSEKVKKSAKKTKLIVILSSIAGVVLIAIIAILLTSISFSAKSYDEVSKILRSAGYDTYYRFDNNTYDKDGKCYKYDYSEQETCEREIGTHDVQIGRITTVNNSVGYEITSSHYLGDDEETKERAKTSISIQKDVGDDQYSYSFDKDDKEDYLWFYKSGGKDCYIINKTESETGADFTICSGDDKKNLENYKNEANNFLKEPGLSKNDLFAYFSEYAETYLKPKYDEAKEALKTKLPYTAIQKYIKEAGYTVAKLGDAVTIYDYITSSFYKQFIFYFEDGKSNGSVYNDTLYEDYSLTYMPSYDSFMGSDKSGSCSYLVVNNTDLNDGESDTMLGSYCSEKDKEQINYLYYSYESEIESMRITRDELFSFAEEYYKKN